MRSAPLSRLPLPRSPLAIVALALAAAALTAGVVGCGGRAHSGGSQAAPPAAPAAVKAYAAARWIPAHPTYAIAARTIAEGQRAARDLLGSFGGFGGLDLAMASRLLRGVLGFDPLSPESTAELGVDPQGSAVLFSEGLSPTLVVRLADPAQTQAFFERQRATGAKVASVLVDGVEVFTVALPGGMSGSWAIADGWMWIHLELPGPAQPAGGAPWLLASRRPGAAAWGGTWQWALERGGQGARPAILGFVDGRALIASLSPRLSAAVGCARLLEPVGRIAVAAELAGDYRSNRLGGRLSIEIGDAAAGIGRAVLPPPAGWAAAAARAPLSVQWNLDLAAVRGALAPCAQALAIDLAPLEQFGVRTARVILQHFNADKPQNSRGAASLDLTSRTYAAQLLDEIPGRSLIERKRTFGPYQGRSLAIPFGGPTIDYVLDDQRALVGIGEGVLAGVVGQPGAPAAPPAPLLAIDAAPPAMPREAWAGLLQLVGLRADWLLAWHELHLAIALDGAQLVIDASGRQR